MSPGVMLLDRLVVHESLMANIALEFLWYLLLMSAFDVVTETGQMGKGISTVLADMWTLTSVFVYMIFEGMFEIVGFFAVRTLKPSLLCTMEISVG